MTCTMAGCREKATEAVAVPSATRSVTFVSAYCARCADYVTETERNARRALGSGLRPSLDRGGA